MFHLSIRLEVLRSLWTCLSKTRSCPRFDHWNVRAGPSKQSSIIGLKDEGEEIEATPEPGLPNWLRLLNGEGFVMQVQEGVGWQRVAQSGGPARVEVRLGECPCGALVCPKCKQEQKPGIPHFCEQVQEKSDGDEMFKQNTPVDDNDDWMASLGGL